jgi:DNA primase
MTWVDFRAVKEAVSMADGLARYSVHLRQANGFTLRGNCPLPSHSTKSAGTFVVNTEKNIWTCKSDSCRQASDKKGGNVLDFVSAMENCSVREAALKLADWFHVSDERKREAVKPKVVAPEPQPEPATNTPLGFQLKGIDPGHPYLAERGVQRGVAEYFGVGFFPGKGSMSGRVVFPIHDEQDQLVAYAGRALYGEEPRYRLPNAFHKNCVLWNLNRASRSGEKRVILVEGFFDCMKLVQAGFTSTVALMGRTLSDAQHALLTNRFREVLVMLDGDEPGRAASAELASGLVHTAFVRIVDLPAGVQPDQLLSEQIKEYLGNA